MGIFNYRIFKELEQIAPNETEEVFTIRQVGYDENNKPINYTSEPYWPIGNTTEELHTNIHQMLLAFNKPVLSIIDFSEIGEGYEDLLTEQ